MLCQQPCFTMANACLLMHSCYHNFEMGFGCSFQQIRIGFKRSSTNNVLAFDDKSDLKLENWKRKLTNKLRKNENYCIRHLLSTTCKCFEYSLLSERSVPVPGWVYKNNLQIVEEDIIKREQVNQQIF